MLALKQLLLKLKDQAITTIKEAWWTEPAMVTSGVVAVAIALVGALGLAVPTHTIEVVVSALLPLILGALIRSQVHPVNAARAAKTRSPS